MRLVDKLRIRGAALAHDLLMIPLAWLGAFWLRFNLESIPGDYISSALTLLPLLMLVQGAFFWHYGLYRGVWRFASIPDLLRIIKAVVIGIAVSALAVFLLTRMEHVPRSVFPLYGLLLIALLGGPRLIFRWTKDHKLPGRVGQRVLIVGAGRAGELLVRDLLRDPRSTCRPAAFVDDDPSKTGREIQGVRIRGRIADIPRLVESRAIDVIMLAVPSAQSRDMRRIVEICEQTAVPFRTVPPLEDLMSGRVSVSELREVSINDLLGREQVTLDWAGIREGLAGKTVLVTGAGGSIGSELCRQIAKLQPASLVLVENSEFNLYSIELELRQAFPDVPLHCHLTDVADVSALEEVFAHHRPQITFHAAAYKHVPMLERQVREAVLNNVLGTRIVAQAADRYGCEEFVLISTDKAVNPTNVMGTSKRVGELFCQNLNPRSATRFITVRFGNVLGSAGSVVPLFRQQIRDGGPVTVTHPEITRYFMTTSEACQLIMQAAVIGKGGEIFVLDMGEPVKIHYLAEQMIRLAGKKPGEDIEIEYTGLRPGEKLFEELFHEQEALQGTSHEKILLARYREVDWQGLSATLDEMQQGCARRSHDERLKSLLGQLVPEYTATPTDKRSAEVISLNARSG